MTASILIQSCTPVYMFQEYVTSIQEKTLDLNVAVLMLQLWSSYFHLAVSFLTQPCLQMEQFSDAKKQKIHER